MLSGVLKRLSGSSRGSAPSRTQPLDRRQEEEVAEEEHPRMPMYRLAILRMCQLQIKICSKLLEHAPRRGAGVAPTSPLSLKRIAGRRLLRSGHTSKSLAKEGALPMDLVFFLQRGARDD